MHFTLFGQILCISDNGEKPLSIELKCSSLIILRGHVPVVILSVACHLCLFSTFRNHFFFVQAQIIAKSVGQAFSIAYHEFLKVNGLNLAEIEDMEYNGILEQQKILGEELSLLADESKTKEVCLFTRNSFKDRYMLTYLFQQKLS